MVWPTLGSRKAKEQNRSDAGRFDHLYAVVGSRAEDGDVVGIQRGRY